MKEFSSKTSIHGVKYIFDSKHNRFIRILWTMLLFGSFCGLAYYIRAAYVKWKFHPDIVMRSRSRSLRDFPAPAITICPSTFARKHLINFNEVIKKL